MCKKILKCDKISLTGKVKFSERSKITYFK